MGVVYKAEDTHLGRIVALKCLSPGLVGNPEALRRFAREARATCAMNHPYILTVYDVGVADGVHYIAAELVAGKTLRELLKEPLELTHSLELARQILEALLAAHTEGVIHRDLKPENIMIRADGYIKVLDFGIARLVSCSRVADADGLVDTVTGTGNIAGTSFYMSPEQALGRPVEIASDLFSFGIVFYEMIAGKHPWRRQNALDTLYAIIHDAAPPLATSTKGVQGLQGLLEKALRKDPVDRYSSARDMLDDLNRIRARSEANTTASVAVVGQRSLAVLPFVFLNQIAERESLSLGFADALITSLGNLEDFLVLPTSAILKYPGGSDSLMVSAELQVRHVLQGNIQKIGSRWRVTLQLYDAIVRQTVLANKLDFNLEDVFEIQDQICQRVADSLSGKFRYRPTKARDRYSTDPYAYDEYLQGLRGSYSDTLEIMENALLHLSQAVRRDPDFALAHAALARVLVDKHLIFDGRHEYRWADAA
jgi:serine/threonine protein kinase